MSDDKRRGTVKLSQYNEQAQVAPSATRDGSIAVGFYNAEGTEPVHPGCFTGDEWDAFVAAGNAALGRPAPASTPLATRIASEQGPPVDLSGICSEGREEEVYGLGYAKGRADAAAMAREAGPTVPRAAVAAVVPLLAGVSTMLADSDDAEAKREAVRRLDRIIVALGRMVTDGPTPTEDR